MSIGLDVKKTFYICTTISGSCFSEKRLAFTGRFLRRGVREKRILKKLQKVLCGVIKWITFAELSPEKIVVNEQVR